MVVEHGPRYGRQSISKLPLDMPSRKSRKISWRWAVALPAYAVLLHTAVVAAYFLGVYLIRAEWVVRGFFWLELPVYLPISKIVDGVTSLKRTAGMALVFILATSLWAAYATVLGALFDIAGSRSKRCRRILDHPRGVPVLLASAFLLFFGTIAGLRHRNEVRGKVKQQLYSSCRTGTPPSLTFKEAASVLGRSIPLKGEGPDGSWIYTFPNSGYPIEVYRQGDSIQKVKCLKMALND